VTPQELFEQADRLEEEGERQRALNAWRQIPEAHPTRNAFLRLGSITKRLGLVEDSESAFQRALEIDGHSAVALTQLGILAIDSRRYDAAETYLKRARAVEEAASGLTLLGVALRNTGKDLEAEEAYRRAIRIEAEYDEAYFNLGVLLRDDRPAEAQALFRKAIELDPNVASYHRELGYVLTNRGSVVEAEEHLRKAIQLKRDDGWAHIYLGTCLWQDPESALREFRIAAELQPDWAVPLWSMGNVYEFAYKDFDSAQSYYQRALQLEPDNFVTLKNLGRLFKKRGRVDLAREHLNRALLLSPKDDGVRGLLANLDGDAPA
jgi:tetratricopeptide (TPR) repeat protein